MLTINYYYQMRAYYILKEYDNLKEVYHKMCKLRDIKKPIKIFSWEEIDAMSQVANNNGGKAYKTFSNVNMKNMNPKEKAFVIKNLMTYAKTEHERFKHKKEYEKLLADVESGK